MERHVSCIPRTPTDIRKSLADAVAGEYELVLMVFHVPSYGAVIKIINDEFGESKKITREQVKESYKLTNMSDCVGRIVDIHEYVNSPIPLHRMCPTLVTEL